jgi:hypothetical protein
MILKKRDLPLLISNDKVWDLVPHSAFTDLVRYQNSWFMTFRESNLHMEGEHGTVRILKSEDGIVWTSVALLKKYQVDLRDPKLSVMPNAQLMLLVGGSVDSSDHSYLSRQSHVAFSHDGIHWGELSPILSPHDWLWRVTWFQSKAYGASYRYSDPLNRKKEWDVTLFESDDGLHYNKIVQWGIQGQPNETTLQFTEEGTMVALVRREKKFDSDAWIGTSEPPYEDWRWVPSNFSFGGPNFIILPTGKMWASGRIVANTPYGDFEKTILARLTFDEIDPVMVLPSGGDTSYPGMVYHQGALYISYYSSHEEKTAIYFAKVQLPFD